MSGMDERVQPQPGPPLEYENLRHKLYSDVEELWFFTDHQLQHLPTKPSELHILNLKKQMKDRILSLQSEVHQLSQVDTYQPWRILEAARVSKLIQKRIYTLQNPDNCTKLNRVSCSINQDCGLACQLQVLVACMVTGYAHRMPVILLSVPWQYDARGWKGLFQPISDLCPTPLEDARPNASFIDTSDVDLWHSVLMLTPKNAKYLPLAIPTDLAPSMQRFTGDPASWWIGQLIKFVFRPKKQFRDQLAMKMREIDFNDPIVGVHVRATDKIDNEEASYHSLTEYMKHVDDYYQRLELTQRVERRRVYLAADDPEVIRQAHALYYDYEIYASPVHSESADPGKRYSPDSLTYLLLDMHLLAACDYFVCTFSSQMGRLVYLMMQANRADASHAVHSLDDVFYVGGQTTHQRVAVLAHQPLDEDQLELEVGDMIAISGNHWDGFGMGYNNRTQEVGLFPFYKTIDTLKFYDFPKYDVNGTISDDADEMTLGTL